MKKTIYLFIFIINSLVSCKDATDFYLGIPLQPKFDKNTYHDGLNIFGVIRSDSTQNYNNSFVELQKIMPAVGSDDSIIVDTVKILIENMVSHEIFEFILTDFDSTFSQVKYRPADSFFPLAGDIFRVECIHHELPVLTALTQVPNKPSWSENSVVLDDNVLSFTLVRDSTIFMYDLYLFSKGNISGSTRIVPENDSVNIQAFIGPVAEINDSIVVFGYDYNLATYYLTSNVSLNFNKYRESFSLVDNGFGVFGAINKGTLLLSE